MLSEIDCQKIKKLVERITVDHGHISSRERSGIRDSKLLQKIERAFLDKDEI